MFKYMLTPMLYLFLCMIIGFLLRKSNILPENSGKVMAKLETWVFCPALNFMTMAIYCKPSTFSMHATNMLLSLSLLCFALIIAIFLAKAFVRQPCYERGVYSYALMFGNFGFLGNSLVLAAFGDSMLAYYSLFTLPLSIACYVWGINVLVPKEAGDKGFKSAMKGIFTPPTVALLLGILAGLTEVLDYFPEFLITTLDGMKACMSPVAMLLAGFTIASYPFLGMLMKKKVYVATALRLIILPVIMLTLLFGMMKIAAGFGVCVDKNVLFFAFFAYAAPLGLNTVVFPEAYGGNPETGASMAMISHTLCVLTIPALYALMVIIFGEPILV